MRGVVLFIMLGILLTNCTKQEDNPFFKPYNTPFETPAFDKIKEEHYLPAFRAGIDRQKKAIEAIVNNPEEPTFANTVEALENSDTLLTRVSNVFFNMTSANTNDRLQAISKEITPLLTAHNDEILMNDKLYKRIKAVYNKKESLNLSHIQQRLLEKYYKDFVRGGADLKAKDKEKLKAINKELSLLTLQFGENVLKENNRFEMVLDNKADLAGLPEAVIAAAAETAEKRGHPGKWVFTLHKPSLIPFLQYSDKRSLREKMFKGYITRGDHNDELDNKKILSRIAALRVERANLLGFKTHADYILDDNMAKTPQRVYDLLNKVWQPALRVAKKEAGALQKMIDAEGGNFKLQPWDWWYYAEKLKKQKYALDDELLRPYFELDKVRDGAFETAHKLYGITFTERHDIPVYHPEVKVFEVKEEDGTHIGILYVDYHPRASKRGGAWMNEYRQQQYRNGNKITPIICNVCNFSRPSGDKPALLSFEEVQTLFHEFGHALQGLLSDVQYKSLSGTSVTRDYVELCSQIMENWAAEPEVLREYARHYKTGEPIPQEYIDKLEQSKHFNQGFATTEYLAAAFLDMDWHTLTEAKEQDAAAFEKQSLDRIGLIPEIVVRYRSPYFRHIFAGGYSAGYYSYIWAEVLDADAFEAFKKTGLFNRETANVFRKNILASGNSDDPMVLYKRFRGREPSIEPLLKRRGLE
ncbi:MAG TPA: M3 family peptidase [Caldithrix abyssi]|uniref:M3 family peptidase n=1 Tax=Caldithrix abyssi TaxID=187145 RepID=A0A7V4U0V6_CALAY|nr:M3 family peptidase [Caldithrix abyssi]